MSNSTAPYTSFARLLTDNNYSCSPAELQGALLGRCCAGLSFDTSVWLDYVADILGEIPVDPVQKALVGLQSMAKMELADASEITITLLLPDDSYSLTDRLLALSQWCQGFLDGFTLESDQLNLDEEMTEVVQDLISITQVQSTLIVSDESSEADYMEIMEYVRVAPLLLFAGCHKKTEEPVQS
ncbi:UNVERIFIED_CONTAM: hypothetical protein GTU68_035419 [Idotea baltica]|nr:hypothetical protein [Idotea baltica]